MSRVTEPGEPALVGCTVVEEAFVCPTGGGFENETWRVQVNDAWLTIAALLRRGAVNNVTAELVEGHDPSGIESSGTLPPQTSFYRRTYVVAPVGTHFWRRVIRPIVNRSKGVKDYLSAGDISVTRKAFDEYYVLRGPERLVAFALDLERRSRKKAPRVEPMTEDQTREHASAIVALLDSGAPPPASLPPREGAAPPARSPRVERARTARRASPSTSPAAPQDSEKEAGSASRKRR